MKYTPPILVVLTVALGGWALVASAQEYIPLVTLPGVTTEGVAVSMGAYLAGAMKFVVALAGLIAILMAIIGGTQYVAAGISPNAKSDAKEQIFGSLIGLALILTSYLLLNSINPKLVSFNLALPPVKSPVVSQSATGPTNSQGLSVAGCADCNIVAGLFPQKAPGAGCASGNVCQVHSSVAGKLVAFNTALVAAGVTWQATEMWPPTRSHRDPCHQAGTCIDAALRMNSLTAAGVKTFIEEATRAGLNAVYEVPHERRRTELIAAGVPAANIKNLGTWIGGEHFSVYSCPQHSSC